MTMIDLEMTLKDAGCFRYTITKTVGHLDIKVHPKKVGVIRIVLLKLISLNVRTHISALSFWSNRIKWRKVNQLC